MTHCTSCGYRLDLAGETLCFPCLLRGAMQNMLGCPPPMPAPKSKPKNTREKLKSQDPKSIAALAALSRPGKSPVRGKKQPQGLKTKQGRHDSTPQQKGGLVCFLCGERVPKNGLLKHKEDAHGEMQVTPSPVRSKGADAWVSIFQGGLPGLGKRR